MSYNIFNLYNNIWSIHLYKKRKCKICNTYFFNISNTNTCINNNLHK